MSETTPEGVKTVDDVVSLLLSRVGVPSALLPIFKSLVADELSDGATGTLKPKWRQSCTDVGVVPTLHKVVGIVLFGEDFAR